MLLQDRALWRRSTNPLVQACRSLVRVRRRLRSPETPRVTKGGDEVETRAGRPASP